MRYYLLRAHQKCTASFQGAVSAECSHCPLSPVVRSVHVLKPSVNALSLLLAELSSPISVLLEPGNSFIA